MHRFLVSFVSFLLPAVLHAQNYAPVADRPPALAREFRGAWIASIYNIDWPSSPGLSAGAQQAEMRGILDKIVALKMNAVIFQVRPQGDAVYASSMEPWSASLTGTMGRSPGYDPLAYCIKEAHARGIEVHAWFNPFRALSNNSQQVASNHAARTSPQLTKKFGTMTWFDPALSDTRSRALNVILDVVKRYDVDGVHLDDYFYPYPSGNLRFPDGKSPAERRSYVDGFVSNLYSAVKRQNGCKARGGPAFRDSRISGQPCSFGEDIAMTKEQQDAPTKTEPLTDLQGQGGPGRGPGRSDPGPAGRAV